MTVNDAQTVMAFDFGTRRIGVAVGQTVSRTATALDVLLVKNGEPPWPSLEGLINEWRPDQLVVGMPDTADGKPPALQEPIERFARRLSGRYGLPVSFVNEHLSSYAARDAGAGGAELDARAARMILETWFEQLVAPA